MPVATDRTDGRPHPADGPAGRPKGGPARRRRPRAPWWTKLATAFGALLVVLSVGTGAAAKYLLNQVTDNVQTTASVLGAGDGVGVAQTGAGGKLPDGAINLLMLGLDTRTDWEKTGEGSRSDTIIVLHIPASHDKAEMISIPRDTMARIPADRSIGFDGATDKINSAFYFGSQNGHGWTGGAKLAAKAVHELTGISFNGVLVIDFSGFKDILEALGGVYMCVDMDMWSSHYIIDAKGKVQYAKGADPTSPPRNALWFRKGCRNMKPWEALEYSRLRHSANGDYDRQRHQQQLLRAMAKKATSSGVLTDLGKVSKLLAAAGSSLKMDTNGVSTTDFFYGLKGLATADLLPIRTNSGSFVTNGNGEGINDVTRQLFDAAAKDQMEPFLLNHPELVIDSTATK
ncbi:LCP family protein [Actinoplanes teichomyceticus]|uniref:LytR family transcriptional attenuator n=1 Tax=Actinoplanes teichomyceticus TaxID=1867 RepID=A0A561VIT9_ACTTI|nr:LCP family protein [Actinoplanes teichomyceticus]TWG11522.1 LytR family transcriptional attenuator [Actinoplanes teichomyceticus]GIF15968.1 LytTR family transcriptional regulator [Actinoplanes teichomyceticus]